MLFSEEVGVVWPESIEQGVIRVELDSKSEGHSLIVLFFSIGENDSWIDIDELSIACNDFMFSQDVVDQVVETVDHSKLEDIEASFAYTCWSETSSLLVN